MNAFRVVKMSASCLVKCDEREELGACSVHASLVSEVERDGERLRSDLVSCINLQPWLEAYLWRGLRRRHGRLQ